MNASSWWETLDGFAADYSWYLAQALVHFLWQGCVVAAVYAVVAAGLSREAAANTRYVIGVVALLLMAACLPVTLLVLPSPRNVAADTTMQPVAASMPELPLQLASEVATRSPAPSAQPTDRVRPPQPESASMVTTVASGETAVRSLVPDRFSTLLAKITPYASGLYIFGVLLMLLRLAIGLWGGRRLRLACTPVTDEAICRLLHDHTRRMGLRLVPLLGSCQRASVPLVVGVLRPMILLPASLASGLTLQELEMVLIHELAHIRRFDPAVNVLQRLVEAMLFFHPAVWWLSRRVSVERENACDDLVLQNHGGRAEYVGALLRTAELCATTCRSDALDGAALAATGGNVSQLKQRVLRLLGHNRETTVRLSGVSVMMSMVLILAILVAPFVLRGTVWATEEPKAVQATEVSPDKDSPEAAETPQPMSMSAEEFGRLSDAGQRALLRRVFERPRELPKNLYLEGERVMRGYYADKGRPRKTLKFGWREQVRHWRMGKSYCMRVDRYDHSAGWELSMRRFTGTNAVEGIGRNACIFYIERRPSQGQVTYPHDPDCENPLHFLLNGAKHNAPHEPLFPFLLDHVGEFVIETLAEDDRVRVVFAWQLPWAEGTREYMLDPGKDFLPVRCDARYENQAAQPHLQWVEERFEVKESRLVGDVWMPVKVTEEFASAHLPDQVTVEETHVTRIERGNVTAADIRVPFTEGMEIEDTTVGVKYVADAQGNPTGPVEYASGWKHDPPEGWSKGKAAPDPGGLGMLAMSSRLSRADREMLDTKKREKEARRKQIEAHVNVLQTDSRATQSQRIEAALEILRIYRISEHEALWASAIRELIVIGRPALPNLLEELDRTEKQSTLRALAFVLRDMADPRSIPALIRAIPRTLEKPSNSIGIAIRDDPELLDFMEDHDTDTRSLKGYWFTYGRSFQEILAAIEKMTGETHDWQDLKRVFLKGGADQQCLQRTRFLEHAQRWADWWSENWQEHVDNEADAQLDQIRQALDAYSKLFLASTDQPPRLAFPRGPKVTEGRDAISSTQPFGEPSSQGFWDIDSGRRPYPSQDVLATAKGHELSKELLAWAEGQGVDLINIEVRLPYSDEPVRAFQPVGMKVWRIENSRYESIANELRASGEFDAPAVWPGHLAQVDASGCYNAKLTASFLFITREGACGAIQLRSPLPNTPYGGGGLHYKFIYEEITETSTSSNPDG